MQRLASQVLAALASASLLAACTSGSAPASPSTSVVTSVRTVEPTAAPTPVSSGPTTAARATSCPLVAASFVHPTIGMRLGRLTVLHSGSEPVGCRFYAYQYGTLHSKEHLPGPDQPAVEITTTRYASTVDAHNAFVLRAGPSATQVTFGGVTGLCFQNAFDPQDKGQDWACTVNKGSVLVLVRSVDTTGTYNTASILTAVLKSVTE